MKPVFARCLPFAVFMAFIALKEMLRVLIAHGFIELDATAFFYLYPLKIVIVGALLYRYRKEYTELCFADLKKIPTSLAVFFVGILVFGLWICMTWTLGSSAAPAGFDPGALHGEALRVTITLFRVTGAVLVVPVMEELFWRSFLIRYIIDKDFEKVPMGTFTWGSFLVTALLFGTEHHYIIAGVMAGVVYNLVIYRTRSLAQCVLAHSVTNLALAVYVISTQKWHFW